MLQSNQQSISGRVALLALVSVLSLLLFWSGRVALAGEANVVGLITDMPTGGLQSNMIMPERLNLLLMISSIFIS